MKNKKLNGIIVYAPDSREELIEHVVKNKKILVAVNAEKILHATDETRALINRNLGYPDGIGAVWALRKKGFKKTIKIPGCELWLDIIRSYHKKKSFYLIGGKDKIVNQTVLKLKKEFSGINICNFRNGYIKDVNEENLLVKDIIKHKPDFIFVAMGSPNQELLMERIQKNYPAVYLGLGGSFDVYTGFVKRAPKWWVNNNLEWAFRLFREPVRIKRQIHLIKFYLNYLFRY